MQEQRQYLQETLPNGCVVIKPILKWGPLFESSKPSASKAPFKFKQA